MWSLIWEGCVLSPLQCLQLFWYALDRAKNHPKPFQVVRGPIRACIATLMRLGWQLFGAFQFQAHMPSITSDANVDCPLTIKHYISRAIRLLNLQYVALSSPALALVRGGGIANEVVRLVRKQPSPTWHPAAAGLLHSCFAGGRWPQQ